MNQFDKINDEDISNIPHQNEIIDCKIVDVYDGDTFTFLFPFGNKFLKWKLRLLGIDTPERRPRKSCENRKLQKKAANIVKKEVEKLILNNVVKVQMMKWDKFGGRVLGNIFLGNESLSDILISQGFGKKYNGEKKTEWSLTELKKIINNDK